MSTPEVPRAAPPLAAFKINVPLVTVVVPAEELLPEKVCVELLFLMIDPPAPLIAPAKFVVPPVVPSVKE